MTEIFERFCDAEFTADWDQHGRPLTATAAATR